MGYTHYWKQSSRFTKIEWKTIRADILEILKEAETSGVVMGDPMGETPQDAFLCLVSNEDEIAFNGLGEGAHETFSIGKERKALESWQEKSLHGTDFCKTARKPYDLAVTAILCYLESTLPAKFSAGSDGGVEDWQAGLALAKQALPRLGNVLQIPADITFDSQFKAYPISGNTLFIAQNVRDEIVIAHRKTRAILATFPTTIATDIAARVIAMAAKDPARNGWTNVDARARWADRQCRLLLQAAPMIGGTVH